MVKIYPGVVGLYIQLDTGISLAGATKTNFKVTDPDGVQAEEMVVPEL